jgi:hypothetical protein
MSLPRFVLVACCSLVAARVAATDLLLPGDYHGDEIAAEDGTTWFALVQDDHGGARLEPRRVGIESVNDPVLDAEDGATGKRVGAGQDDVLFYVRDLPGVASGPVATAYAGRGDPLSLAGLDHGFLLFDRDAGRLRLDCSGANDARDCVLVLSHDGRQQALGHWSADAAAGDSQITLGSDAWPHLRWAGDIDRDGRLDLLIDMTDHYNVSAPTLFLSTQAKDGELVGAAAELRSVGC